MNLMELAQQLISQRQPTPTPQPQPTLTPQQQQIMAANGGKIPDATTFYREGFDKVYPQAAQGIAKPTPTSTPKIGTTYIPGFKTKPVEEDLARIIVGAANTNKLDPAVLAGILFTESGIRRDAGIRVNPDGSRDRYIAQINDKYHPEVSDEQAKDPNFAINYAAKILAGYRDQLGGDINRAIAAYNVGPGGASVQGQNPYGGGPMGQRYLNAVSQNLDPELIQKLGIKMGKIVPIK